MSTIDRLRAQTKQYSAAIVEAREAHVVRVNTLATEATEIQSDYIKALESRIELLEAELVRHGVPVPTLPQCPEKDS